MTMLLKLLLFSPMWYLRQYVANAGFMIHDSIGNYM